MVENENKIGPWSRVRVLGRGGFGLVTLWRNQLTDEHIAIKCLRENDLQGVIKPKHKERWCKEVEIMHRLKHKNVVSAIELPEALASIETTVPLLSMEYCRMGDLRQVLIKPENSCGLQESKIFDILGDISNGLSYLHSCKITHRDLKPDNIMLQAEGDKIVYKLIDLGYAKELDQNSLCESFVGTVQYLAPELFTGKPYTSSVDYWSFGQVAHEIITGHRPFLPGYTPATWFKEIENKKRNVITVLQGWNGEIIHSSSLSKVNHLSSCLREDFEKWLQLALEWDGKARGRDPTTNEIAFFTSLKQILEKQVVRVFSLPNYEVLSYPIRRDMSVANLQAWIARDTGLEADNQMLIALGKGTLKPNSNLMNSLPSPRNREDVVLFVFSAGQMKLHSKTVLKPLLVRELMEDPKKLLEYPILKRSSSDSIFFLQSEAALYKHLVTAVEGKIKNLSTKAAAVESLFEEITEEWQQLDACAQFFILSHKTDLENYIELRKAGTLTSSDLVQKWIKKAGDVESKLNELKSSANVAQQKEEVSTAKRNATDLVKNPLVQFHANKLTLDELLKDGLVLYERIQKIPKDVQGHPMSNTDMVRVLYKCMEASAKVLRSPELNDLFLKIFESEYYLSKLISPLAICLKSTKIMRQIIESTQKERQREVWGLIKKIPVEPVAPVEVPKNSETVENEKINQTSNVVANGKFSPFHIPKTVYHDLKSPHDENMVRPNFHISGPASFGTGSVKVPSFIVEPPLEVDEIIKMNCEWRYRTQDLTQSCHSMVREIQSLNWDFLNET